MYNSDIEMRGECGWCNLFMAAYFIGLEHAKFESKSQGSKRGNVMI